MRLILLGPPGSGKGTQAAVLNARLGVPTISTGNILRTEIAKKSEIGIRVEAVIASGQLVPDEMVLSIIKSRLGEPDCANGFILDGFPRTIVQAEALEEMVSIDTVLLLTTDDETIVQRMSGRRTCKDCSASYHIDNNPPKVVGVCNDCGGALVVRNDDASDTVLQRLKTYHTLTVPLLDFYQQRGLLRTVKQFDKIEETQQSIFEMLGIVTI